ncbi:hypothetical protein [Desulfosporosinus sp. BICA1-9]|uniref:hypothetical protein n=1 Tax=Desulfosporosinus sp. BICA1-9 TaxID=1531958 RepID=UPI00054C0B6A|nr:hypothetical protein [Desulfosporosinus sp. BICA1-9]KJS46181.1 MAG: hypothetical protein VR66_26955 [Peptococcaceae bacterium BRH_c23]KJS90095.1 MAG: hypothetical protein JL57_03925 [Desulfosporosinus sp. BICA1-9]HBW36334.1 hypothetical protein [Desulfosporosinus sp.]
MNAQGVLNYLEMLANHSLWVNFSMHMMALMALFAIFVVTKENLKRWIFQAAVSILFLSVTINALIFGNPFHAVTFGILALTALVQLFVRKENIKIAESKWIIAIALFFIFMGLWYPEFVDKNALMLLVFSPVGVIPCSTLLTTIGLLTLIMPSVNRFQYLITIIMGIVYGVIGVFVFSVYLDITLLILALYASGIYFVASPKIKSKTVLCSRTAE